MKDLIKIFEVNKKLIIGLLLFLVTVLVFVKNDAFLYKDTVVKVIKTENKYSHEEEGPNGEIEKYYDQKITAKILNGKKKGKKIQLQNTYSSSGINTEHYYYGDHLFVSLNNGNSGSVIGKKRDFYVAILLGFFLFLLIYLNRKHGVLIFVSLFMNLIIFLGLLYEYQQGGNLVKLSFLMMFLVTVLTLLFAGGIHKKTFVAILSSVTTTLLCFALYEIVLHFNERLPYEMMDYVVNPKDLSELFLAGVLMGSLGAVMDVAISIAAGTAEILETSKEITLSALIKSIREMGYDIMGTMINVLFFTYISSCIPIVIVKINNGYTLYHLINFHLVFEIIRFLMGAIGIVLAIPVAGLFSVLFLYGIPLKRGGDLK